MSEYDDDLPIKIEPKGDVASVKSAIAPGAPENDSDEENDTEASTVRQAAK